MCSSYSPLLKKKKKEEKKAQTGNEWSNGQILAKEYKAIITFIQSDKKVFIAVNKRHTNALITFLQIYMVTAWKLRPRFTMKCFLLSAVIPCTSILMRPVHDFLIRRQDISPDFNVYSYLKRLFLNGMTYLSPLSPSPSPPPLFCQCLDYCLSIS